MFVSAELFSHVVRPQSLGLHACRDCIVFGACRAEHLYSVYTSVAKISAHLLEFVSLL